MAEKKWITWPKDTREAAAKKNNALFAFGYDGSTAKGGGLGSLSAVLHMSADQVSRLSLFCVHIYQGKDPAWAFHDAYVKTDEEKKAEAAAKPKKPARRKKLTTA